MVNTGLNPSWGTHAEKLQITGTVQGVGFRPTIYRLVIECNLTGSVANHAEGIVIYVAGQAAQIDSFVRRLQQEKPAVVRIDCIDRQPIPLSEMGLETIAVATQTVCKAAIRDAVAVDCNWGSSILAGLLDRPLAPPLATNLADLIEAIDHAVDHVIDRAATGSVTTSFPSPPPVAIATSPIPTSGDRHDPQSVYPQANSAIGDLSDIANPDHLSSAYSHSTALRMQSERAQRREKALENALKAEANATAAATQGAQLEDFDLEQSTAINCSAESWPEQSQSKPLIPESSTGLEMMPVGPMDDSQLRGQRCPLHLRPEWRPAYRDLVFDDCVLATERASSPTNLPSDRWSLPAALPTLLGWLSDAIKLPVAESAISNLPVNPPPTLELPDLESLDFALFDPDQRPNLATDAPPLPEQLLPTHPPEFTHQQPTQDAADPVSPEAPSWPASMDDLTPDQALSDALANELANLLSPLLDIDDDLEETVLLDLQVVPPTDKSSRSSSPSLPPQALSPEPQSPPPSPDRRDPIDLSSGAILRPSFLPNNRDGRRVMRSPSDPISPDLATCSACLRDLHDPKSRFYHDPFVSCAQCGPRLSVARSLPNERARTSLAGFHHCADCAADYADPESRRFQSQTASCPVCGPSVWFEWVGQPNPVAQGDRAIEEVAQALRQGVIIAVKGLGGVHLVCDATQEAAVQQLRSRKQSPDRPFPILVRHLAMAQRYCQLNDHERALLTSPAAPIVLLSRLPEAAIAPSVAPGRSELGVMLPDSPLHHLLMAATNRPLVFTSANPAGEPPCLDNQETRSRLSGIADGFLLHNQPIVHRVDDSVMRVLPRSVQMIRRSRGYAPAAIPLPGGFEQAAPVLAMGGDRNNALCFAQQGEAILSPHLGDLNTPTSLQAHRLALSQLSHLFGHRPSAIAVDSHPEGRSRAVGAELAATLEIPLLQIQRHHAQIAACLVDRDWDAQQSPVLVAQHA